MTREGCEEPERIQEPGEVVRNRKVPEEEMGKQVYTVQGRRWSTGKDKKNQGVGNGQVLKKLSGIMAPGL